MALDRRRISLTTPATPATVAGTLNLASDYVEIIGFRAKNVTDAGSRIKITDGLSRVLFLNAGDIAYNTQKDTQPQIDNTTTGLFTATALNGLVNLTGAASVTGSGRGTLAKNPIAVEWSNNGTAGDILDVDIYYRYPCLTSTGVVTIPAAATTGVGSVSLGAKYAQIVGLTTRSSGSDGTAILEIKDADGRTVFLDIAARDYKTADVHNFLTFDSVLTGITPQALDATGVAATAATVYPSPVIKSPITLNWSAATAADVYTTTVVYTT